MLADLCKAGLRSRIPDPARLMLNDMPSLMDLGWVCPQRAGRQPLTPDAWLLAASVVLILMSVVIFHWGIRIQKWLYGSDSWSDRAWNLWRTTLTLGLLLFAAILLAIALGGGDASLPPEG